MNNRKGFTLVQLLAVIVILGVISVIIAPKVVDIIKDSNKKSYEVSVNNLVKALNEIALDKKANLISFEGCSIVFDNGANTCSDLQYSGDLPTSGSISVDKDGNVFGSVGYGDDRFEVRANQSINVINGYEYTFDYTGGEQVFPVLTSGYYRLETWGAQGGDCLERDGGYGSYSTGVIDLTNGDILYINVGGRGSQKCEDAEIGFCYGGYNGGGNSHYLNGEKWGAGGGATHIALKSGLLSMMSVEDDIEKVLIVSGGGGGRYSRGNSLGSGGGYIGNNGYLREGYTQSIGGSQASGGTGFTSGSFGLGGSMTTNNGTGGGAGFYGAGSAKASSAGGGSGYIGNEDLFDKHMTCFECTEANGLDDDDIRTISTENVSESPKSNYAKKGNGFVKITYLGESID